MLEPSYQEYEGYWKDMFKNRRFASPSEAMEFLNIKCPKTLERKVALGYLHPAIAKGGARQFRMVDCIYYMLNKKSGRI